MDRYYIRAKVFFFPYEQGGQPQMPPDGYIPSVRIVGSENRYAAGFYGLPEDGKFETWYEVQLELPFHNSECDHAELGQVGARFEMLMGHVVKGVGVVLSDLYVQPSLRRPT